MVAVQWMPSKLCAVMMMRRVALLALTQPTWSVIGVNQVLPLHYLLAAGSASTSI